MPAPLKVTLAVSSGSSVVERVIAVVLRHDLGAERFCALVERIGRGHVVLREECPREQLLGNSCSAPGA